MTDETTPKRGRGKPLGSLKADARRIAMKLRWRDDEIALVKAAAEVAGEDLSHFIRQAALDRAAK